MATSSASPDTLTYTDERACDDITALPQRDPWLADLTGIDFASGPKDTVAHTESHDMESHGKMRQVLLTALVGENVIKMEGVIMETSG
jgi:hypothetical protein